MILTDRIFGAVVILVALAMIVGATGFQMPFFDDPVGPRTFPILIAALMIVCGAVMIWRADPDPDWPRGLPLVRIVAATVVMIAYAYALKPLGFLIPTAIGAAALSWLIRADLMRAALAGLGLSAGLFLIFKYALGLSLVPWPH